MKAFTLTALGIALTLGTVLTDAGSARAATATGCSFFGAVPFTGRLVPTGDLCLQIRGQRGDPHSATKIYADFGGAPRSNWHIDFVSYDSKGKVFWRSNGPVHTGTSHFGGDRTRNAADGWLPYGRTCALLVVDYTFSIAKTCVSIAP